MISSQLVRGKSGGEKGEGNQSNHFADKWDKQNPSPCMLRASWAPPTVCRLSLSLSLCPRKFQFRQSAQEKPGRFASPLPSYTRHSLENWGDLF